MTKIDTSKSDEAFKEFADLELRMGVSSMDFLIWNAAWQASRAQPINHTVDDNKMVGLPPPVMSDDQILEIAAYRGYGYGVGEKITPFPVDDPYAEKILTFVRAILAAQADHAPDARQMVAQSTNEGTTSKKADEIDRLRDALTAARPYVLSQNQAEGMMEGFGGRKPRPSDADLALIDEAIAAVKRDDVAVDAKDAERYRWWCSNAQSGSIGIPDGWIDAGSFRDGEANEIIDAAIAASKKDAPSPP